VANKRTEVEVLTELSEQERRLLKRVLEIERAKLHLNAADLTDDIARAVLEIYP
jgi:hypothetical protein